MTKFGLSEPDIHLDNEAFNFPHLMPKKDTILLTKDGTVGTAYKIEKDSYFITSGAILHLTVKDKNVLPDYLTLVLNSVLTKLQAERDAGGSIIQHWKPSEIQEVIIPILPMELQERIIQKIQESFSLKTKSEQLLSLAKRAVELAIEEGEEAASGLVGSLTFKAG
jgi:type I restriction enzyme, S subunit